MGDFRLKVFYFIIFKNKVDVEWEINIKLVFGKFLFIYFKINIVWLMDFIEENGWFFLKLAVEYVVFRKKEDYSDKEEMDSDRWF